MNPNQGSNANSRKGFWEVLFEPSFSHFVTPRVIGIVYFILVGIIGIASCTVVFNALTNLSVLGGNAFLVIILAPIGFLLYVILLRVMLESVVATIRSAEYLRILAEDKLR